MNVRIFSATENKRSSLKHLLETKLKPTGDDFEYFAS